MRMGDQAVFSAAFPASASALVARDSRVAPDPSDFGRSAFCHYKVNDDALV